MTGFMWLFYWGYLLRLFPDLIGRWWLGHALSGITLGRVPIEEPLWAGAAALFIGPAVRHSLTAPEPVCQD